MKLATMMIVACAFCLAIFIWMMEPHNSHSHTHTHRCIRWEKKLFLASISKFRCLGLLLGWCCVYFIYSFHFIFLILMRIFLFLIAISFISIFNEYGFFLGKCLGSCSQRIICLSSIYVLYTCVCFRYKFSYIGCANETNVVLAIIIIHYSTCTQLVSCTKEIRIGVQVTNTQYILFVNRTDLKY